MKKVLLVFILLVAFTASPAHAWLEVEGSYWFMRPSGNMAIGIDGLEGTTVDLENDLGYGSRIGVPDARIIIGKYVEIGAEFFKFSMSANNAIHRDVRFHDLVFPVDADVSTALDATFARGFARINLGTEALHGGILGGGQYMDFSAKASSSLIGSTEKDVKTGMPYVGAFLELSPVDWLAVRGSICGFKWDFGEITAKFVDAEVGAMIKLDWFFAGGGYRYVAINGEDSTYPVTADLKLSGPTVFAGVNW
ncbi:MAG: hypothetical protein EPN23_01790 [Verrucomicrobia bacterium]|nr:MAG: hypothetical protein EPN23_01790 [Verrucomicrobiota bacterium]